MDLARRTPFQCDFWEGLTQRRFLWRYHPPVPLQDDPDREREGQLDVYTWTGVNAYVALCEQGYISFGGGCVPLFFPSSSPPAHKTTSH